MDELAAVIRTKRDRDRVSRLLGLRNYRLFERCETLCTCNEKFKAILIVHRGSHQTTISRLPNAYLNSRIIVLSDRTDEKFIVDTLYAGACHYFYTHDSDRVLKARIDAALRHRLLSEDRILDVEPYVFNADIRAAYCGEQHLDLSPREFALAHYLFSNRSRVVSDVELMTSVWTLPPSSGTRRISTVVCSLKKKMGLNTQQSRWQVVRLRTQGYQVHSLSAS